MLWKKKEYRFSRRKDWSIWSNAGEAMQKIRRKISFSVWQLGNHGWLFKKNLCQALVVGVHILSN